MSTQEQARQAFRQALKGAGRWDPAVLLGLLGEQLHRETGFTGVLGSVVDFDALSDSEATLACTILPALVNDLPDLS